MNNTSLKFSYYKYKLKLKAKLIISNFLEASISFVLDLNSPQAITDFFDYSHFIIAWKRFLSLETDLLQHFSTFQHRKRLNQLIWFLLLNQFHKRLKFRLWLVFHFQFLTLLHRALVARWWTKMESELFWFAGQIKFQTEMMSQFCSSLLTQPIRNLLKISFLTPKFLNPIGKFKKQYKK